MQQDDPAVIVVDALSKLGIAYMLVGSYSSNMFGIPRSTIDADFVVAMSDTPVGPLATLLQGDFVLDPQMGFETVTGKSRWLFVHRESGFKIELFILGTEPYDLERFRRRRPLRIAGRDICFQTPEDVVINKLRWKREKDKIDIKDVMMVQGAALDWSYIELWCEKLGVSDQLAAARADAGV